MYVCHIFFFFSSRRRHTRCSRDWSSDVCSSDLTQGRRGRAARGAGVGGTSQQEVTQEPLRPHLSERIVAVHRRCAFPRVARGSERLLVNRRSAFLSGVELSFPLAA